MKSAILSAITSQTYHHPLSLQQVDALVSKTSNGLQHPLLDVFLIAPPSSIPRPERLPRVKLVRALLSIIGSRPPTKGCQFDCSTVNNSNGAASLTTCNCVANYNWSSTSSACQIDCSKFNVSQKTLSSTGLATCGCAAGYSWSGSDCVFNCSTVTNNGG